MLLGTCSGRCASIRLVLACAFVLAMPQVALPQDCSSFGNATAEDLQTLSAELSKARVLEQERGEAAYQQIWNNADVAVKDIYNFNLGRFFGRAEDYEKLQATLGNAETAFKTGQRRRGMSITLDLFKQASALTSQIGGTLNPLPYTNLPSNPKEAKEFVDNALKVVKQYAVDGKGQVVALGRTGNAMADLENSNLSQASLAEQIADIQRCLNYAPHKSPVPTKRAEVSPDGCYGVNYDIVVLAKSQKCGEDSTACFKRCEPLIDSSMKALGDCNYACMHASEACEAAADTCP
jgi:uncharacterized protein YerC